MEVFREDVRVLAFAGAMVGGCVLVGSLAGHPATPDIYVKEPFYLFLATVCGGTLLALGVFWAFAEWELHIDRSRERVMFLTTTPFGREVKTLAFHELRHLQITQSRHGHRSGTSVTFHATLVSEFETTHPLGQSGREATILALIQRISELTGVSVKKEY